MLSYPRRWRVYLPILAIAFAAGLTTHLQARHLPHSIANYGPDTLWALWLFLAIALIIPRHSTLRVAAYALVFSYVTEASQLYHAAWIDGIRHAPLGHIIFGDTFAWSDLLCYTMGILIGASIDRTLCPSPNPQKNQ